MTEDVAWWYSSGRVQFTAACPGCGADASWEAYRADTLTRHTITCDCREPV